MSRIRLYGAQFGMALLLSLALWTYVSFTTNPTSTRIVTTTILSTGLDDTLVLVDNSTGLPEQLTQSTTITLSGPKDDLAQVVTNDVHATIDLSEIGPGLNQVPVTTKIDQTGIVRATELKPAEITVRIARNSRDDAGDSDAGRPTALFLHHWRYDAERIRSGCERAGRPGSSK